MSQKREQKGLPLYSNLIELEVSNSNICIDFFNCTCKKSEHSLLSSHDSRCSSFWRFDANGSRISFTSFFFAKSICFSSVNLTRFSISKIQMNLCFFTQFRQKTFFLTQFELLRFHDIFHEHHGFITELGITHFSWIQLKSPRLIEKTRCSHYQVCWKTDNFFFDFEKISQLSAKLSALEAQVSAK